MNSLGYKYAERCVTCEHQSLCFAFLELAGDVTREGKPIFHRCADITANPEKMKRQFEDMVAKWQKQKERLQGGTTAHAEGWKEIK